jgi:hypothetical protein
MPNYHLTARPRIFFPGRGPSRLAIEICGADLPATIEFTPDHMTYGTAEYRDLQKAMTEADRKTLCALIFLRESGRHVGSEKSAKEMLSASKLLFPEFDTPEGVLEGVLEDVKRQSASTWIYPAILTERMEGARIVMTRTKPSQPPVPAIMCPDIVTAAFVYAAWRGVKVCLGCRQLFAPSRENAKYCSATCGQRVWQQSYRDRAKRKGRKR